MTWQPGQPVITPQEEIEWRAWRKARILEGQRERRKTYRRTDYYPSKEAAAIIDSHAGRFAGGDFSSIINHAIEAWGAMHFRN